MDRPVVLVLPPCVPELFDSIYPSLPVLAGCLAGAGFASEQRDANRAYLEERFGGPSLVAAFQADADALRALEERERLGPAAAARYRDHHLSALAAAFVRRNRPRLTTRSGALTFQLDGDTDLTGFLSRLLRPDADGDLPGMDLFVDHETDDILEREPLLVGLSVAMGPQLGPAVALARRLRERAPGLFLCLGGPVISLLDEVALADVLRDSGCDAAIRYDGEEALPRLAEAVAARGALDDVPNLARLDGAGGLRAGPPVRLRSLDTFPEPLYDAMALAASPHARLAVVASRGCYWGRCAYCDYVKLYGPGPYRPKKPARAAAEVAELVERTGRTTFELITDSLAPGFARRFSDALVQDGTKVTWSAYIRVDDGFDAPLLKTMRTAGCRAVTVGIESVDDRLLAHVGKGTTRETTEAFLDRLLDAGLRVWVNLIPDLPTATAAESLASLQVVAARADRLAGLSAFSFALTRSSPMGRDPAAYGLEPLPKTDQATRSAQRSYKGLACNDVPFRDPAGMSDKEKAEVLARYGAVSDAIRARDHAARAATLLPQLDDLVWSFRHAFVQITPCRFVPDPNAAGEITPRPSLVLYDVTSTRLLAVDERLSPLLITATSLKQFQLSDLAQTAVDALHQAPEDAAPLARRFLEGLVREGMISLAKS